MCGSDSFTPLLVLLLLLPCACVLFNASSVSLSTTAPLQKEGESFFCRPKKEREREDVGKTQHKPKEEEDDDDDFEDATFFFCVSHSFFPTRKALFFLYLKTQEFFVIV